MENGFENKIIPIICRKSDEEAMLHIDNSRDMLTLR